MMSSLIIFLNLFFFSAEFYNIDPPYCGNFTMNTYGSILANILKASQKMEFPTLFKGRIEEKPNENS